MKTLKTLISVLILASSVHVFGQQMFATSYIEQTCVSPKLGTSIGFSFANEVEVGGFYQRAPETLEAPEGRPLTYEQDFYGLFIAYPLKSFDKAAFKLNIRTGVCNKQNFVITPSVNAEYKLFNRVSIGGGFGARGLRPTMMANLRINL